jgi:hypothetical protein
MIARCQDYADLGANYFDERNKEMVKQLESLGFQIELRPVLTTAA